MKKKPSEDLDKLIGAISELNLTEASLSRAYYYAHLPLALIDSIFSINVRYTQVENVILNFCNQYDWPIFRDFNSPYPPESDQKTISDLLAIFDSASPDQYHSIFGNRGFINPASRSPSLKSEVVRAAAQLLKANEIESFQDFQKINWKIDEVFNSLPGLGSGVVLSYLRMLVGDDNEIKPDRHILRFLQSSLDRQVTPQEAVNLLRQAADYFVKVRGFANVTPRLLDHLIWLTQSRGNKKPIIPTLNNPVTTEPPSRPPGPPRYISSSDGGFPFEEFWKQCQKGGNIQSLTYLVDEDERLCIQSSNCTLHQQYEQVYRIKRSTVRNYVLRINERGFRTNHGWFCKVFDFIMAALR